jgi:hypothetical protein
MIKSAKENFEGHDLGTVSSMAECNDTANLTHIVIR